MDDVKTIVLAGRNWDVPELSVRQIIKIVPQINSLRSLAAGVTSEADLSALYGVVYTALTKAYPDLTREQFDDMHITIPEIGAAIPVIAAQAGLEWRTRMPGEAEAKSLPNQTGTI